MLKAFKKVAASLLSFTLLVIAATSAFAAPVHQMMACEQNYVVQADDWLSKLADKYFGDMMAYPAIVEATNAAAQDDGSYATIANPDLIEVGWQLCIPSAADAQALLSETIMGEEMMGEEMMGEEMAEEEMMSEEMAGAIPALPSSMSRRMIRRRTGWLTTFSASSVVKPTPVNAERA